MALRTMVHLFGHALRQARLAEELFHAPGFRGRLREDTAATLAALTPFADVERHPRAGQHRGLWWGDWAEVVHGIPVRSHSARH